MHLTKAISVWVAKAERNIRKNNKSTIILRDIDTPLINRSNAKKFIKDIINLSNTINQSDLNDIYRIFHLIIAEYIVIKVT